MKHVYLHTYHPCSTLAGIRKRLLKILRYVCVGNGKLVVFFFLLIVDYRNELNNIWPHTKRWLTSVNRLWSWWMLGSRSSSIMSMDTYRLALDNWMTTVSNSLAKIHIV
jgi:hypothetical protein